MRARPVLQQLQHFPAVKRGHHDVESNGLRQMLRRHAQRLLSRRCRQHVEASAAEIALEQADHIGIVIDDEDAQRAPRR
jgi:hypothetical protein